VDDLAAEVAFWSVFALFPFSVFILTLFGYIPLAGLNEHLLAVIHGALPSETAALVDETIHEILGYERGWLLILSLLAAIWTASAAISGLMTALNKAYGVRETRPYWVSKSLSILLTVVSAVLLIVAIVSLILGPEVMSWLSTRIGFDRTLNFIWAIVRWPLILAVLLLDLALIYHFIPNVKQRFRFLSPGAVFAVASWAIASFGLNLYVSNFDSYARSYGTLGAAMVLLLWLFISAFVVILGGEINAMLDRMLKRIKHQERYPTRTGVR